MKTRTPPVEGDVLSDAGILSCDGTRTSLSELASGGLLLVFVYRGSWCAFCLRRLGDYRYRAKAFRKIGVRVSALSVDAPSTSARIKNRFKLPFDLLCDTDRQIITEWDLLNPREMHSAYPATLLIDSSLKVRFASHDDGYSAATVDDVLEQCRTIAANVARGAAPQLKFRIPGVMWWLHATRNEIAMRFRGQNSPKT